MKNKSGIQPVAYKVLVLPDPVEQKTSGGIILTDDTKEKSQAATTRGVLVAASPLAFSYENGEMPADMRPKVGDRICMGRYVGVTAKGADGQEYRLVNDEDIIAVETERAK